MKKLTLLFTLFALAIAAAAQSSKELIVMLPKVDGWTLSDKVETFNRDNLFDRINGAADVFLICDFVEMTAVDYTKNGSDKYVTFQMYRHASPSAAFAIYSAERSAGPKFLTLGAEGYKDAGIVNFLCGSMYIKISTSDDSAETAVLMETAARALAAKIDPHAALPAMLKAFPEEKQLARSDTYIIEGFLGHKFMLPAWRATYSKDGKEYQLFIIDGKTKAGTEKMLGDYIKFNKQKTMPTEGQFVMSDRFNGDIPMLWRGQYLFGVVNESGAAIDAGALLKQLDVAVK